MSTLPEDAVRLIERLAARLEADTGRTVDRIETHVSWVLLDGEHAWKIKKPLELGFLDFRELEIRRHCCEEELRLNRRLAPSLYLDVVPVTGAPDLPRFGGTGPAIEYALRMKQFAAGALFSELLDAGRLTGAIIDRIAERLAAFQAVAAPADPGTPWGSAQRIRADVGAVLKTLAQGAPAADLAGTLRWCEAEGGALAATFEARKATGAVREGHGDLHLANLVLLDDGPTAFDCIEFDPGLRWIDIQCDIAFPVMDLHARGRPDLAARFLDRWLAASGDYEGLAVLRYYLVYRALVRAMVAMIRRPAAGADASGYAGLARRLSEHADARLLITHGLSGSGKSHVSGGLVESAGAVRLRSDVERKRLAGLAALASSDSPAGAGIYDARTSSLTYARLRECARAALRAGWPVIVDATFLRSDERDAFRTLAHELRVPFAILHCHAAPDVLRERVRARAARGDDASEADLAVLEQQIARHDPLRADERALAIDVDTAAVPDLDEITRRWQAVDVGPDDDTQHWRQGV